MIYPKRKTWNKSTYNKIALCEPAFTNRPMCWKGPRVSKERNIPEATFSEKEIGMKDEERPTVQFYQQNRLVSSRSLSHPLLYERSQCHVCQPSQFNFVIYPNRKTWNKSIYHKITSCEPAFRNRFTGPCVGKERKIHEATFSEKEIGMKDEERPAVQFYLQNRLASSLSLGITKLRLVRLSYMTW